MAPTRRTADEMSDDLNSHLQYHKEDIDPKLENYRIILENYRIILFGEKGDNGLCSTARNHEERIIDMEKVFKRINGLIFAVVTAVVLQLVYNLPKIIAMVTSWEGK